MDPSKTLPSEPANVTTEKAHATSCSEAWTVLLSVLSDMDLRNLGSQPFRHRSPVARKNSGYRETLLTETVDEIIADIWENELGSTSQQSPWALNCLIYAGGKAMEILGERKLDKVRQLT